MGIYLSKALTTKESDVQESQKLAACSTDMQGWRVYMEDAHIMYLDNSKDTDDLALFGVFDGHGGPAVARWVALKFMDIFKKHIAEADQKLKSNEFEFAVPPENLPLRRIAGVATSLHKTFLNVDELLFSVDPNFERELKALQNASMRLRKREMTLAGIEEPNSQSFFKDLIDGKRWRVSEDEDGNKRPTTTVDCGLSFKDLYEDELSKEAATGDAVSSEDFNNVNGFPEKRVPYDPQSCGCTAVVASIIINPTPILVVANAGDSRCVLSRGGVAKPMTMDHKPMQEREMTRISLAGGAVTNGRVDGNLNLSRSLGDLHYKKNTKLTAAQQKISAVPDLTFLPLTQEDDFVILACDGIWDILDEQECVDKVRSTWHELITKNNEEELGMTDAEICREIAAKLCDDCIAPTPFDPESAGAGCDNMTAMVIRIKDEWRSSFPAAESDANHEVRYYGTESEEEVYRKAELLRGNN